MPQNIMFTKCFTLFDCLASNEGCPRFFEADNFIHFLEAIGLSQISILPSSQNGGQPLILCQTNKGEDIPEEFFFLLSVLASEKWSNQRQFIRLNSRRLVGSTDQADSSGF